MDFVKENHVEEQLKADKLKWQAIIMLVFHEKLLQTLQALLKLPPPRTAPTPTQPAEAATAVPEDNIFHTFLKVVSSSLHVEHLTADKVSDVSHLESHPASFLEFFHLEVNSSAIHKGDFFLSVVVHDKKPYGEQLGNLFFRYLIAGDASKVWGLIAHLHISRSALLVCCHQSL